MREKHFPLAKHIGVRVGARLLVDPRVVQLAVQKRTLESFDDLELGIESRFDRELAQQ